jgi:hypothetical protein
MKRTQNKKTKKHAIEQRKLPSGNQVKVLNEAVRSWQEWATNISKHPELIDQNVFTLFLQVMFASLWLSPQGRVGAIMDLLVEHFHELMTSYVEGFRFKTSPSLGIQSIIFNRRAR